MYAALFQPQAQKELRQVALKPESQNVLELFHRKKVPVLGDYPVVIQLLGWALEELQDQPMELREGAEACLADLNNLLADGRVAAAVEILLDSKEIGPEACLPELTEAKSLEEAGLAILQLAKQALL